MEDSIAKSWIENVIKQDEIDKYKNNGKSFIDDELIWKQIEEAKNPDNEYIRKIIQKSLNLNRLDPVETAALINVTDPEVYEEMKTAALKIKKKVYGNRVVTFAPLYLSDYCVNNCEYCGYRITNKDIARKRLGQDEVRDEINALVNEGHKRLIMVYGEHPSSDFDYIAETIKTAYSVKNEPGGEIRRVNVNAAPLSIEHLKVLKEVGIGTYQIFQETYHKKTYKEVHTSGLKANYDWRLYGLHRCQEAGIDDVGIGALFGLYDWRFEVMGLLYHTIDMEEKFNGVGPHTISFPRIEPAVGTSFTEESKYLVNDDDFEKLVTVLRLSVPYTGMILTARETPEVRDRILKLGCTQLDFGTNIGIGQYSKDEVDRNKEQFLINDSMSLDEGVRWLAERGHITSFCTAGYRCGRTGNYFMEIAKEGKVHSLCMPNAIMTFKEYLLDYASEETIEAGNKLIEAELEKLSEKFKEPVIGMLERIENGERDIFF